MKNVLLHFILIFFSTPLLAQEAVIHLDSTGIVHMEDWVYSYSKDTSWTPFEDKGVSWLKVNSETFRKKQKGIHWYKACLSFKGEYDPSDLLVLHIYNLPIAYEIYLDGKRIGRNGTPGIHKKSEKPGKIAQSFPISQKLTQAGEHQLVLKTSNARWVNLKLAYFINIGYQSVIQSRSISISLFLMRWMSVYLLTMIICIVLYFGGINHRTLLFFSCYALTQFLVYFNTYIDNAGITSIHQYQWMNTLWYYIVPLSYLFLFSFLYHYFESPWNRLNRIVVGMALIIATSAGFILNVYLISLVTRTLLFGFLLYIVVIHLHKKVPGSRFILLSLLLQLFVQGYRFYIYFNRPDLYFFPGFIRQAVDLLFPALIMVAVIIKVSDQYRTFQIIGIKAKQLEEELQEQKKKVQFIVYRKQNENHLISVENVRFFKAERFLIEVHLQNGEVELLEKPLNQLEEILPEHFMRIHRSYIVNLRYVTSYKYVSGGAYEMLLKDGLVLPISRYRVKHLKESLKS